MNKLYYGILCYSKKNGTYYARYLCTISKNALTLEEIKNEAFPSAVKIFTANTKNKCVKMLSNLTGFKDPPQKGLFD